MKDKSDFFENPAAKLKSLLEIAFWVIEGFMLLGLIVLVASNGGAGLGAMAFVVFGVFSVINYIGHLFLFMLVDFFIDIKKIANKGDELKEDTAEE